MSDTYQKFLNEAMRIVEAAKEQGVVLRLMGALAIRYHCHKFVSLHEALGREFSDIDFAAYKKQAKEIGEIFERLGYKTCASTFSWVLKTGRLIFENEETGIHVDVFLDKLEMCHTIDWVRKLEDAYPTIPLAELLLEKMQIVKIGEKDVIDTIVMIRAHEVGNGNNEKIDIDYISKLLSKDWGFYYTVTTNLNKVKGFFDNSPSLSDEDKKDVTEKINIILDRIEKHPKSLSWKMRAKVGTKRRWYKLVEGRA